MAKKTPTKRKPRPWIYTSRYQNGKAIAASGLVPVGITLGNPRFTLGYKLARIWKDLAPDGSMFHLNDRPEFERVFVPKLEDLGIDRVIATLEHLRGDAAGVVLLCFEDVLGGDWCHRQVVADWIHAKTGMVVPELRSGGKLRQLALVTLAWIRATVR